MCISNISFLRILRCVNWRRLGKLVFDALTLFIAFVTRPAGIYEFICFAFSSTCSYSWVNLFSSLVSSIARYFGCCAHLLISLCSVCTYVIHSSYWRFMYIMILCRKTWYIFSTFVILSFKLSKIICVPSRMNWIFLCKGLWYTWLKSRRVDDSFLICSGILNKILLKCSSAFWSSSWSIMAFVSGGNSSLSHLFLIWIITNYVIIEVLNFDLIQPCPMHCIYCVDFNIPLMFLIRHFSLWKSSSLKLKLIEAWFSSWQLYQDIQAQLFSAIALRYTH